jgi:hypothetical protein
MRYVFHLHKRHGRLLELYARRSDREVDQSVEVARLASDFMETDKLAGKQRSKLGRRWGRNGGNIIILAQRNTIFESFQQILAGELLAQDAFNPRLGFVGSRRRIPG